MILIVISPFSLIFIHSEGTSLIRLGIYSKHLNLSKPSDLPFRIIPPRTSEPLLSLPNLTLTSFSLSLSQPFAPSSKWCSVHFQKGEKRQLFHRNLFLRNFIV